MTQQQEKGWFNELEDGAQIKDVHEAFLKQHEPDVWRTTVEVRERKDSEMLKPSSKKLTDYFVPPADLAAASGPGKSEDTFLLQMQPVENDNLKK